MGLIWQERYSIIAAKSILVFCKVDSLDMNFSFVGGMAVMFGQGIVPSSYHPLVDAYDAKGLHKYLSGVSEVISRSVDSMPSHAEFIAKHCAANSK